MVISIHGAVSPSTSRVFSGTSVSAGPFLAVDFPVVAPSGFSFSGLNIDLIAGSVNAARIISFGDRLSGALNEDVTIPAIWYSSFNTGVWEWGSQGGDANDGVRLEIGQSVIDGQVPLPAGLPLVATGLAVLALLRRKRACRG